MIEENKIVTLENNERYLILTKQIINNTEFILGIKINEEKITNEYKAFIEHKKNNECSFEEIDDNNLLTILTSMFMIEKMG